MMTIDEAPKGDRAIISDNNVEITLAVFNEATPLAAVVLTPQAAFLLSQALLDAALRYFNWGNING